MTYPEAVTHLNALVPELMTPGVETQPGGAARFDLANMRRLCLAVGDPQHRFPSVLIAGTNGKGSTAATLASILCAAGYRTGLYTSPHLIEPAERIQIAHPVMPSEYGTSTGAANRPAPDGPMQLGPIPGEQFARLYFEVDQAGVKLVRTGQLAQAPSFFERLTAMAFLFFAREQVDLAVLEVGLGGRLDATNVVEPRLSLITDIALDHQALLGNTLAAITGEKAGILRPGGTLVTLPQHPEVNQALGDVAMRLGVRGVNAAQWLPHRESLVSEALLLVPMEPVSMAEPHYFPHQGLPQDTQPSSAQPVRTLGPNRFLVALSEGKPVQIESPLPGEHQRRNLALAIAAAVTLREQGFLIADDAIVDGIAQTRWPGRLESIAPNLLLDVAHNPAGAWTLRSALARLPEEQPRTLLFSCLRDKDLREMTRILFPLFDSAGTDPLRRHDHVILAPIQSPRAARMEDLLEAAHDLGVPAHAAPHLAAALNQARQITPAGGLIVVTGSVYLVGAVRELALEQGGRA